jgi:glycosyltransferase involved in cell wall biosynthesis
MPKVSVCLPNLNNRPFLRERFDTILNQTLRDWELIVVDNYSEDGAWELIQQVAKSDARLRVSQAPRQGMYANWNNCIRQAQGEYVYIATSDDTMMPECLEKMVSALEANPDCGLCQCGLLIIDEKGEPLPETRQWNDFPLPSYDGNLRIRQNKRFAPHDGLLHPAVFTVYTSITQLLIRRTVFDRIGLFEGQWGSIGDFEWGMRAGLVENCIYIPDILATWRIHANQATQNVHTSKVRLQMVEMSRAAFAKAKACTGNKLEGINVDDFVYFLERDFVELGCNEAEGRGPKARFLLAQLMHRPRQVIDCVAARFRGRQWGQSHNPERYERLKQVLKRYNVPKPVFG